MGETFLSAAELAGHAKIIIPFSETLTKLRPFSMGTFQVITSLKFNFDGHVVAESFCFTPEFVEKVAQNTMIMIQQIYLFTEKIRNCFEQI